MSRDPSLNGMIYFEAVARHGRVARAADDLKVSPSAVSQQIKLLEEVLGVSLFRRDKRQLSLTLEGEQLFTAATSAFGLLRNARQTISRQRESHQLIIRMMPSFAVRWLGPRLAGFIRQNPEWDLRIDASPDPSNFDREVVDFDIRYGPATWEGLHCELVLSDYVMPMCSPAYRDMLREEYGGDDREMLCNARLIDSVKAVIQWDNWLAAQRISRSSKSAALRFDRSSMALEQAVNDIGVVLEATTLARKELFDGSLVPLAPTLDVVRFPAYWIVSPSRHQSRKLVQVFKNWLLAEAEEHERVMLAFLKEHNMTANSTLDVFNNITPRK
ncbi:LysR family transcriptional regulator [Marinobacter sp. JSM 1782161]|uniref:LysR family transcriptional regulator n=1 Tax=Marinobacter sp. JSM 1782161 TaxID=2685906 RepID=UPI001401CE31|nr:LysR family transcriptional regulator [Marinobacter sp. JSM 1782161]